MPELLTPEQVAKKLHVRETTLATWRSANRYPALRHVKIGARRVMYLAESVEAFIAAGVSAEA